MYADGRDSALTNPSEIAHIVGHSGEIDVLLGWTVRSPAWLNEPDFRCRTFMAGYGLAHAVTSGRCVPLPVRLSAVPAHLAAFRPDVAVIAGIARGDGYACTSAVGWADAAALSATRVVVEVAATDTDRGATEPGGTDLGTTDLGATDLGAIDLGAIDLGGPVIPGNIVATVARPGQLTNDSATQRPADEIDVRIGELVVSLLPEQPTLQFGPGGIGEGIARALNKPVNIWSGLLTDAMAELDQRGLLLGPAVAAYTWGGEPILRLATKGLVRLTPVSTTHDIGVLAAIPRFVGCNTAIQIALDGSVNVERVGGRTISSVGGHADFCAGASRSIDGISIIALRSCTNRGESTIVPVVEVVSTARCDVQVVVTEHGIADLRGVGEAERVRRMIQIAAPQHRASLSSASGGQR